MTRLPGVQPLGSDDWLHVDEVFADQMAYRAQLLRDRPAEVLSLRPEATQAAAELLAVVLNSVAARADFRHAEGQVTRPDGVQVALQGETPLHVLNKLVQEDFCILQKRGEEHVLTAGLLCFPASWRLDEKIGHPLVGIHAPVAHYDTRIAMGVQRLFDRLRPGQPLWRANALIYADPDLHQPRGMAARRIVPKTGARWVRSERQTLLRLPLTGAVVFSIHTYVLPLEALPDAQRQGLVPPQNVIDSGAARD